MKIKSLIKRAASSALITTRRVRSLRYLHKETSKLINNPIIAQSHYPAEERKSKFQVWLDNFLWALKYGEVNNFYYGVGMDKKGSVSDLDVLPFNEFCRIRDSKNLHPDSVDYNYVGILRDKFIFSQLMKSFNFPTAKNIALLNRNGITWLSDMSHTPLESLVENTNLHVNGFCKKLVGMSGKGAFPLAIKEGKLYVKDDEISLNQLREWLDGQFLLQDLIIQHPEVGKLHPQSVNSVRVITFNNKGRIEVFCAALRIGTKGRSVDNWGTGGIAVNIDLITGKLKGKGVYRPKYGGRVAKHPDTGIMLDGFEVPFFHDGIKLVSQLHSYMYGIHSVGWDFAITPDGPVIIEGNDDWGNGIPTLLVKNFKSKFLKYYR